MKRLVFLISLLILFGCATTHYAQWTDEQLIEKWNQLSYGKAIAQDVIWSMGFMSLNYGRHRGAVATELQKRNYIYWNGQWIKQEKFKELNIEKKRGEPSTN